MTTLVHFYGLLSHHDWYYSFSDDYGFWKRGSEHLLKLKTIAEESAEHKALFDAFELHHFSGTSFNTPKAPLPAAPVEYQAILNTRQFFNTLSLSINPWIWNVKDYAWCGMPCQDEDEIPF